MTYSLIIVRDLLILLKDEGYEFACVGGAARDTFLGRVPKDYDLVALKHVPNVDDLKSVLFHLGVTTAIAELGSEELAEYENKDNDRGLEHVLEFDTCGVKVQLLLFSENRTASYDGDPAAVVEDHDCSLNHAWFESPVGSTALVVRVGYDFPSTFTGNVNTFRPGYSDHERFTYMENKFPEFTHK